jgi:hypothetical protein
MLTLLLDYRFGPIFGHSKEPHAKNFDKKRFLKSCHTNVNFKKVKNSKFSLTNFIQVQKFKLPIFGLKLNFEHLRSHLRSKIIEKKRFSIFTIFRKIQFPRKKKFRSP